MPLCPICGDPVTRVNPGRYYAQMPDGTLKVRTCPECEGGAEALAAWQAAVMAGYPDPNIPEDKRGAKLSDFDPKLARLLGVFVERGSFQMHNLRWYGLHVFGETGVGKSWLGAACVLASAERKMPGLFYKVSALLERLRSTYDPDSNENFLSAYSHIAHAPLLVLDDYGTQTNTPWAMEKLYNLVDDRCSAFAPTIVTSNLSLEALREMSEGDWTQQRIISRLIGMLYPIELRGADRRVR